MNFTQKKLVNLVSNLINIFTDYSFTLDNYFKDEKNRKKHLDLYNEYMILNQNLKKLKGDYKL